jgi:protein-tyrosine phosphatase
MSTDQTVRPPAAPWIALDGAVNARVVVPGALLRSDNLQALSPADVRHLVDDHGLDTVLDLRTEAEIALEGPGPLTGEAAVRVEHRSLYPAAGNTDVDAGLIRPWDDERDPADAAETAFVAAYMRYLSGRPDSVAAAVRTIARADGAVLVHCAAGKDRTGVVVAAALDAVGVDRAEIAREYLLTGDRIAAIVERLLGSPTYRDEMAGHPVDHFAPKPGTIERVFELVDERYDGTAALLRTHGVTDDDLSALAARLGR